MCTNVFADTNTDTDIWHTEGGRESERASYGDGGCFGSCEPRSHQRSNLKDSDLENTTEFKVRKLASEKLNTDLNSSSHKKLVRKVVEDYLNSKAAGAAAEEEEANEDQKEGFGEAPNDGKPVENDSDEDGEKQRSRFAPPPEQRKKQTSVGGDNDDQVVCQVSLR